jgi:hypothetical protein
MNMDNVVHCAGVSMRDKKDWDGSYPYYEATRLGFVVHVSHKASLAGKFTNYGRAEMAFKRYRGKIVEADERLKQGKK